ncbi:MAG: two-component system sensor histidine kinase [Anaerolineales bacterium]
MVVLTREQLEDRLAALHQASLELVRNLSLDTVLERIVQLAREQADAEYALLGVLDEYGKLKHFVQDGMSPEDVARMPHPPRGLGLIGAIQRERRTVRVPDIAKDVRSVGFPKHHPDMRSFLGVPILQGERLLGQLYLTNKRSWHEFTENDEYVIETLAAYAAIAINNARLYEGILQRDQTLIQRNEDLNLINDVAATLTISLDVDEIIGQTLSRVMAYLDVEAGEILLREEESDVLRLALHRGEASEAFWTRSRFRIGECLIGSVAQTGLPIVTTDLQHETRYLRPSVVSAGFRCLACIPLVAQRKKVVGVMSVATRSSRQFDEREINLLSALGVWAGTAIENAQLHGQARRIAVLEERERIGMDLHDGIIQSIYAVGLALDFARVSLRETPDQAQEKINQAIEGLNRAIRDIRSYILDLRPRQFNETETLLRGLQRLIDEFRANTTIEASLAGPDSDLNDLPTTHAVALFHICQEALANAAKHAKATRAAVTLWATEERVLLEIVDNGRGFDLAKMSTTLGHGLSNMHRRARKVGGDVEISSAPGEGTSVLAWVPRRL